MSAQHLELYLSLVTVFRAGNRVFYLCRLASYPKTFKIFYSSFFSESSILSCLQFISLLSPKYVVWKKIAWGKKCHVLTRAGKSSTELTKKKWAPYTAWCTIQPCLQFKMAWGKKCQVGKKCVVFIWL